MSAIANPAEESRTASIPASHTDDITASRHPENPDIPQASARQTFEMRSPDGSAELYQLIAGLCVACRHGFEMEDALEVAERTYVNVNIHSEEHKAKLAQLAQLPDSCIASSECLAAQRAVYEEYGVFSAQMLDSIITTLKQFHDRRLRKDMEGKTTEMMAVVNKYFHCG